MLASGFAALSRFGEAVALIDASAGEVSYAELAARCEAFAGRLGEDRQLVLLQAANDLDSVVAYLAALGAGHAVILTGEGADDDDARIRRAFAPGIVCRRGEVRRVAHAPSPALHPDLAVLLPTSGTTGSPKLVRLSHRNLQSNAEAIVAYLGIEPDDRAITSLPIHYSYGLSVLNSHLQAGASVALTGLSVADPAFWDLFRRRRATSIAGVPHTYEIFERIGLRADPPETLRTMTQAGGKLPAELTRTYAEFGAERGVRFYAMYGQTEASPRMAYLPPEMAHECPDRIGLPIRGGSFSLLDEDGREIRRSGVTGELVYRGPNVMMGYAEEPADLARGPELKALRTGDLARRAPNGLYRIVGRSSRFAKIAGLRIGLDDLEAWLAERGRRAFVAGSDERICLCVTDGADPEAIAEDVARRCGLPLARVTAFAADGPPRLASGKVDYAAVREAAEARAARERPASRGCGTIAIAYGHALGIQPPPPEASFASLGGDSLSYVSASLGVERALGCLPLGWETLPITTLELMAPARRPPQPEWMWTATEMVARIVALTLVMVGHSGPQYVPWARGGANLLFALAGLSLARFQGANLLKGDVGPALRGAIYRVILPYWLCIAIAMAASKDPVSPSWLFLASVFVTKVDGVLAVYWFIQSLFHALLITCGLMLIPAVRQVAAARPVAFSWALVGAGAVLMGVAPHVWNDHHPEIHYTVDAWLYLYFLGWGAGVARTAWQKAAIVVMTAAISGAQYGVASSREVVVTLSLAAVMFVPRVRLPKAVAGAVVALASASYFIYLAHPLALRIAIHMIWLKAIHPWGPAHLALVLGASTGLGLAFAWAWRVAGPWLRRSAVSVAEMARNPRMRSA